MTGEVTVIDRLGRRGDGIAAANGTEIFVPFALPGEKVRITGSGVRRKAVELMEPSRERVDPPCRYFGECGGCQLQHWSHEPYRQWKRALVVHEMQRVGIDAAVTGLLGFEPASRRRLVLTAKRHDGRLLLGFSRQGSRDVIGISKCAVSVPAITDRLDQLGKIAEALVSQRSETRVSVLAGSGWLDVAATGEDRLAESARMRATKVAMELDFARVSYNREVLIEKRRPSLRCGKAAVVPPPGGFVQAIAKAEATMAQLARHHLGECRRVADLFCGHGAFALRLAEACEILALDYDGEAIHALENAWRGTGGALKKIEARQRDLLRSPLSANDLADFDGALFDPPRAGAESQARELAMSAVRRIVAVSCNPVTLARDLSILVRGGFRLSSVVPIDQFRYTPHVEAVALLCR